MMIDNKGNTYIILCNNINIDNEQTILDKFGYDMTYIKQIDSDGVLYDTVIAYNDAVSNNTIRENVLYLLNIYDDAYAYVKYHGEDFVNMVSKDGTEVPLDIIKENNNKGYDVFLINGYWYSFIKKPIYRKPTKMSDFKKGMVVEFYNNNRWNTMVVENPPKEYDTIYKLFIKYDKIRIKEN